MSSRPGNQMVNADYVLELKRWNSKAISGSLDPLPSNGPGAPVALTSGVEGTGAPRDCPAWLAPMPGRRSPVSPGQVATLISSRSS